MTVRALLKRKQWAVLVLIAIVINLAAGGIVAYHAVNYIFSRYVATDCFPEYMACTVETACENQRQLNAQGYIAMGNYPGCDEPQHIPDELDPLNLLP